MNGEDQLNMWISLAQYVRVGNSLIIDTFQNNMTTVIRLTLNILPKSVPVKNDRAKSLQKTRSTACPTVGAIGNV